MRDDRQSVKTDLLREHFDVSVVYLTAHADLRGRILVETIWSLATSRNTADHATRSQ